ncbi:transposase [soil metagenome]
MEVDGIDHRVVLIGRDEWTDRERATTIADDLKMALAELLEKVHLEGNVDFLREGVRVLSQAIMELEVTQQLGASHHECRASRSGQRNGYRERQWDTRVDTIELQVPRLREGGFIPSLLERRKRAERALVAVVQEAYVQRVPIRKVDDLMRPLGTEGVSKSQAGAAWARMYQELDTEVERFRTRPLTGNYPYL